MKKEAKNAISIILVVFLITQILSVSTFAANGKIESPKNENTVAYPEIKLEDLPEAVTDSIQSNDKDAVAVVNEGSDNLYSVNIKNDDGSNTIYAFAQAIKYVNKEGELCLKKDRFEKSNKKIGLFEKYVYQCTENVIQGYFPNEIAKGIKIEYSDYSITFSPVSKEKEDSNIFDTLKNVFSTNKDENGTSENAVSDYSAINSEKNVKFEPPVTEETTAITATSANGSEAKEPEPAVLAGEKGNKIVYDNAFSDSTALEYIPVLNGIKENIILKQYEGNNVFEFIFFTNGLLPSTYAGSAIELINPETNESELVIGQVDAKDSFTSENVNGDTHFTLNNFMEIYPTGNDSEYILKIIVDKAFLESEKTVYPVIVDPTIEIDETPIYDAPVFSGYPNTNYRTNTYNTVGYYNSSYKEAITFVKVDCMGEYTYVNPQKITSAYFHTFETSGHTSPVTIQIHDTNEMWNNSTITYSNMPGTNNYNPAYDRELEGSSKWYNFYITGLVKKWLSYELNEGGWSQGYGFALVPSTTGASYRQFRSANSSTNPPSLVINYTEDTSITNGVYYIKNVMTGKYLDAEQSGNYNVITYPFHGNTNQQWYVEKQSNDLYILHNYWPAYSGYALDAFSTTEISEADLRPSGSGSRVTFRLVKNADGTYRIMAYYGGEYRGLDAEMDDINAGYTAVNAIFYPYQGTTNEKWVFEPRRDKGYINHSGNLYIGISSDNYIDNRCSFGERVSSHCADYFKNNLCGTGNNNINIVSRFNRKNGDSSKYDFLSKAYYPNSEYNIDDVHLMLYVGHGRSNYGFHFTNGVAHTDHNGNDINLPRSEVTFGYQATTKWVAAYTCNFLNGTNSSIYSIMKGCNIVLGYASTSYLVRDQMKAFALDLNSGENVIDAWFWSGVYHTEYAPNSTGPGILRAVYISDARNDTIYRYLGHAGQYGTDIITYIDVVYQPQS